MTDKDDIISGDPVVDLSSYGAFDRFQRSPLDKVLELQRQASRMDELLGRHQMRSSTMTERERELASRQEFFVFGDGDGRK